MVLRVNAAQSPAFECANRGAKPRANCSWAFLRMMGFFLGATEMVRPVLFEGVREEMGPLAWKHHVEVGRDQSPGSLLPAFVSSACKCQIYGNGRDTLFFYTLLR